MNWLTLNQSDAIASPGLIVDADRVADNIREMITIVGGSPQVARLRPHVKTHKMPDVIRMQLDSGITKFKAATLAEAEMVAGVGPTDVLLAYQPVGPNIERLATMVDRFPQSSFAAITDDVMAAERISAGIGSHSEPIRLFIDVDCGMHRTGIEFGDQLDRLRETIESLPGVMYGGLHVYDGHIHAPDLSERESAASAIIRAVQQYDQIHPSPTIIGGGSPTFAVWAGNTKWECSPGTPVFWDVGYGVNHPDLSFNVALAVLTRVISKPGRRRLCLDLGHKAIAAEMPLEQRVYLPQIPDATFVGQSEEHLVIETESADTLPVGHALLGYPRHVCPTVALHSFATIIRDGVPTGQRWPITARDR